MLDSLPKLYAITDRRLSGISHPEQVAALCAGGVRLIQLREKDLSSLEFYAQARSAMETARRYGARIIINDRIDIAHAIHADGVHLGQEDLPVEAARALLGEGAIIGMSTHSAEQAVAATFLPLSYIALGPVFPTVTKDKADPVVGIRALEQVRNHLNVLPLVGIGGITMENAAEVLAAGADIVAVAGGLVGVRGIIESRTKAFLSILQSA